MDHVYVCITKWGEGGRENEPLHFFQHTSSVRVEGCLSTEQRSQSQSLETGLNSQDCLLCPPGLVKCFFGPVNKAVKSWWWKIIKAARLHSFPPSLVCVETCIYTVPNERLWQNGIRYEPRENTIPLSEVERGLLVCAVSCLSQCKGWTWKWFSVVWWVSSGAAASKAPGTTCLITHYQPKVQCFSCHRCNITNYIAALWVYSTSLFSLRSDWFHFPSYVLAFCSYFPFFLCNDLIFFFSWCPSSFWPLKPKVNTSSAPKGEPAGRLSSFNRDPFEHHHRTWWV